MKPSERIEEIRQELNKDNFEGNRAWFLQALTNYLDEVYEAEEKARQEFIKNIIPMD